MRRLQERILGPRWMNAAATGNSIWLLGICYNVCGDDEASRTTFQEFLHDFSSRIWMTYRQGYEAFGDSKITGDAGWGCTIRSGQMLMAQALFCHYLGRSWRREVGQPYPRKYLEILELFRDSSEEMCTFSIHNLVKAGGPFGLNAGAWLGPYAFCRTIEATVNANRDSSQKDRCSSAMPIVVHVLAGDAEGERGGAPVLCVDDIVDLCSNWKPATPWSSIVILVPLVLGLDKINPRYLPSLQAVFSFPQSLGIVGGKLGSSAYLVGAQDDQALYLDPHEIQQAVKITADMADRDGTDTYHCSVVRRMPLDAVDPSLAMGFYCRDKAEFDDLCVRAQELDDLSNGAPIFTVSQSNLRTKGGWSSEHEKNAVCQGQEATRDGEADDWQIL